MTTIPTIAELQAEIIADLENEYSNTIPLFGKVFLRAIALVQAAKLKLFYLAIANVQRNIFVDTAQSELVGGTLERFGRVKLNRNPLPAQAGEYVITVTGTAGATIPAQTTFKSDDGSSNPGKLYILDSDFTLAATTDKTTVRALEAGTGSRLIVSDTMTATAPILNVDQLATVFSETTAPVDAEDLELYRKNVLNAFRTEAQGGAPGDYRIWAADAAGVAAVYPYAKTGTTWEFDLFVEATAAASTDGKGTPGGAIINDVEAVIDLDPDTTRPINERGRRPLNAVPNVQAVTVRDVDITINSLIGATSEEETAIEAAIELLVGDIRPFVAGADILANKNDILDNNRIISAVLSAMPGAQFTSVTLEVDATVYPTFTFINGDIPYLNSVTFA